MTSERENVRLHYAAVVSSKGIFTTTTIKNNFSIKNSLQIM